MTSKAQYIDFINQGIVDDNGECVALGKVYTYATGTNNAKDTYTDRDKNSVAANPIILDAYGRAEVYGDGIYKFVVKDVNDVTLWDLDGIEIQSGADFLTAASPELDTAVDKDLSNQALINGNFDLWQNGTSFPAVVNLDVTANRWSIIKTDGAGTAPTVAVAQSTSVPDNKSKYSLKVTSSTTGTIGAGMEFSINNSLSDIDWEKYIGETVSFSFYANVNAGVSFGAGVYDGVSTQSDVFVGTGAWTLYTKENFVLSGSATQVTFKFIIANSVFPASTVNDYYFSQAQLNQGIEANLFFPRFYNQELLYDNPESSSLDIITNGRFETSIDGWNTYADAAGATPVDGTGGSPVITFARSTTTPLFNTASGLLTKTATDSQGQGVSTPFTLPLGMISRDNTIELYSAVGGTYVTGDLKVYIYDITNATLITPSVTDISSVTGRFQAQWRSTASTSYRLILHVSTTSTNAYTCKIDNISIFATIAPVDSIGTVQLTSANGNISTSFTKTADHKLLRFSFSGAALGNLAGSVALAIGGVTKMTWTTQGPPAAISGQTTYYGSHTSGGATILGHGGSGGPTAYLTTTTTAGSTGASGMLTGQDWFDITSEANGSLAIAVTFTNITNGSAAIYRNRV